jgi:hypothetical protein
MGSKLNETKNHSRRKILSAVGAGGVFLGSGFLFSQTIPLQVIEDPTEGSTLNVTIHNDTKTAQEITVVITTENVLQSPIEIEIATVDSQEKFEESYTIPTDETVPLKVMFEQNSKQFRKTETIELKPSTNYEAIYSIQNQTWETTSNTQT